MRKKRLLKIISIIMALVLFAEIVTIIAGIRTERVYAKNIDLGNKYLLGADYDSAVTAFSEAI